MGEKENKEGKENAMCCMLGNVIAQENSMWIAIFFYIYLKIGDFSEKKMANIKIAHSLLC